jgi:hypothetical protein
MRVKRFFRLHPISRRGGGRGYKKFSGGIFFKKGGGPGFFVTKAKRRATEQAKGR